LLCGGAAYLWFTPAPERQAPAKAPEPFSAPIDTREPRLLTNRLEAATDTSAIPAHDKFAEAIRNWHPEVHKPYSDYSQEELERAGMTPVKLYAGGQGSRWQRLSLDLRRAGKAQLATQAEAVGKGYWRLSAGRKDAQLEELLSREKALVAALSESELAEDSARLLDGLSTAHAQMSRGIAPDVRAKMASEDLHPEGPRSHDDVEDDEVEQAADLEKRASGPKDADVGFEDAVRPARERSTPAGPPPAPETSD
jgi:hypothetical protein